MKRMWPNVINTDLCINFRTILRCIDDFRIQNWAAKSSSHQGVMFDANTTQRLRFRPKRNGSTHTNITRFRKPCPIWLSTTVHCPQVLPLLLKVSGWADRTSCFPPRRRHVSHSQDHTGHNARKRRIHPGFETQGRRHPNLHYNHVLHAIEVRFGRCEGVLSDTQRALRVQVE